MNKKAQTSEIFFFILAILIIGLLLLFGVKYIMELGNKVNQIELVQFKTDLESSADEIRPVYAKWRKLELSVPQGVENVCFVQHDTYTAEGLLTYLSIQQQGLCLENNEDYDFLMCNAWQDDQSRNVYTDPFDELDIGIYIEGLEVRQLVNGQDVYYLCTDTSSGVLKVKMTGKGDRIFIEEWT